MNDDYSPGVIATLDMAGEESLVLRRPKRSTAGNRCVYLGFLPLLTS